MTDFHDVRFPVKISYGSTGGPERRVDVITLASGHEERNTPWAHPRHRYDIGYGIKRLAQAYEVVAFYQARLGMTYGFRYKDWADWKSGLAADPVTDTDQQIGIGDNATVDFQLIKDYTDAGNTYTRLIQKPVTGTVVIALDGAPQASGWSVDTATGIVTFSTAPGTSVSVTAGFEFDVPVRFDTDHLALNLANYDAGEITNIPLIEVKI